MFDWIKEEFKLDC